MKSMEYYPLTHTQKRVYYSEKTSDAFQNGEASMYTIGGYVIIDGSVDYALLEKAIIRMLCRYDVFRLRLIETDEGPQQFFCDEAIDSLPFFDFTSPEYQCVKMTDFFEKKFKEPFPAEAGKPLYYFCIYKDKDNRSGYFFKLHHIMADGWSVSLIMKTISQFYNELRDGLYTSDEDSIENDEFSYKKYIKKEAAYKESRSFEKDKSFWTERFSEIPKPLFNERNDYKGERAEYEFSYYTKNILNQIVKKHGVTVPALFSALSAIYFMNYYNNNEIVIGIPVYNRDKDTREVCGLFTSNTLLKLSDAPEMSLIDYVMHTKKELNLCYYHNRYPYDLLIKDIGLQKKGMRSLYQVSVNYYNTELSGEFSGMAVENYELYGGQQFYPLQIVIKDWNDTEGLSVFIDYQTAFFSRMQLDDFIEYLKNGIYMLWNDPGIQLKKLPLVTGNARNELLYGYNSVFQKTDITDTVIRKIEKQAEMHPERVAVTWKDSSISYRELNVRADSMASFLQRKHGISNCVVAIISRHTVEYIIAALATMKAGYAFLPIDPDYPMERIEYVIDDADVAVLLTDQDEIISKIKNRDIIDLRCPALYSSYAPLYDRIDDIDSLAYIIYTSGSTGKPKGVRIGHKSFSNYIEYATDTYIRSEDDVFAFFTSISFDLTITSVFAPLAGGVQIRIYMSDNQKYSLYDIINDNRSTIVKLTPSHLVLMNELDLSDCIIHTMILGGENLLSNTVKDTFRSFGHTIDIYNEYGPTEATVGCMTYLAENKNSDSQSEPIGYPIKNTELYVLNNRHQLLPKGAVGELYIAGDCLALGYMNDSEATDKAFVQHFMDPSRKMYKTGDMVKILERGCMEYIGRDNDYVKISGYRIDTNEIERTIRDHTDVKSAVVACFGENGKQIIAAFVAGNDLTIEKIRYQCESLLPSYMIPQFISILEQIPLTGNGKPDLAELESIYDNMVAEEMSEMEYDNTQKAFIEVFRRLFRRNDIDMTDNFFEVGGDSIKAIQASGVFKKNKMNISVGDIINNPVFADMYEHYYKKATKNGTISSCCSNNDTELKMTPIIKSFFDSSYKKGTYYNQSVLLKMNETYDVGLINKAFYKLIEAHEMLRIEYDPVTNKLFYRDLCEQDKETVEYIIVNESEYEKQIECMRSAAVDIRERISIENGIAVRGGLFCLPSGDEYLFITIHHLAVDGVSWRIILDDLLDLLTADDIDSIIIESTDRFIEWANVIMEKGMWAFDDEKEMWTSIIRKGTDNETEPRKITYNDLIHVEKRFSKQDTERLLSVVCNHYRMRPDEILLSVVAYCLMKNRKRNNQLIMVESHGRDDAFSGLDTSRTVGWFTSVYPVLLYGDIECPLEELLTVFKEQMRGFNNMGIGYGVNKWLKEQIPAEPGRTVCFNYLGDYGEEIDNASFSYSDIYMGEEHSPSVSYPYEIEINAMVVNGELKIDLCCEKERADYAAVLIKGVEDVIKRTFDSLESKKGMVLTPSDFTAVELSSDDLQVLFEED